jgi:predicted nucleotidyltransferase
LTTSLISSTIAQSSHAGIVKIVVNKSTDNHRLIDSISALVHHYLPKVQLIYLFGSMASNKQNSQSDIDIAILCEGKLDAIKRWDFASVLADKLGREVDLVDLNRASTVMQHQITWNGTCLYDPHQMSDQCAIRVLSMYHDLNIERADIENQSHEFSDFASEIKQMFAL